MLLTTLAFLTLWTADPLQTSEADTAALDEARAQLARVEQADTPEKERWRDAYAERVRLLEELAQTAAGRAALPQAEEIAARASELEAQLGALRGDETAPEVSLVSADELAQFEQAAHVATAARGNAQATLDSLITRRADSETELAALPERGARAGSRAAAETSEDVGRYAADSARIETRIVAERTTFLTEALATWRSEESVLLLDLERATLVAERADALAELASTEATRLREIEAQAARESADAEARRAEAEQDPIERFRYRIRAEAGHLVAAAKAFETELSRLKDRIGDSKEAIRKLREEREALEQRLKLRPRGVESLLKRHRDRARSADRLLHEVKFPLVNAALDANQEALATLMDRLWTLGLPAAENEELTKLLAEVPVSRHEEATTAFEAALDDDGLTEALEERNEQLTGAAALYSKELAEMALHADALLEFEDFVFGRLLWTRTDPAVTGSTFSGAWKELGRLFGAYRGSDRGAWFARNVTARVPVGLLALGGVVILHFSTRRLRRRPGQRPARRRLAALLWAMGPALQLLIVAWAIRAIGGPVVFDPTLAVFLELQALFLLGRRLTYALMGVDGLLIGDDWVRPDVGAQLVFCTRLFTLAGQVAYAPLILLSDKPFQFEHLPRFLHPLWALLASLALLRLIRRNGPVLLNWTPPGGLLRPIVRVIGTIWAVTLVPVLALDVSGYRVIAERVLKNGIRVLAVLAALAILFRLLERVATWLAGRGPLPDGEAGEQQRARRLQSARALTRVSSSLILIITAIALRRAWGLGDPIYALLAAIELVETEPGVWLTGWDVFVGALWIALGHLIASNLRNVHAILLTPFAGTIHEGTRYASITLVRYLVLAIAYGGGLLKLGFSFATLGWFATAASVGLGFGLQEIVANFISGLILLFERPIRVGDIVSIGPISGTVNSISMRATTITNWERQTIIVPNKKFVTEDLTNWTRNDKVMRRSLEVRVAYGTDVVQVRQILDEVIRAHPAVLADPPHRIWFQSFGSIGIEFQVLFFCSIDEGLSTRSEIHAAITERFAQEGIRIPTIPRLEMDRLEAPGPT